MLKKLINLFYPKLCSGCTNLLIQSENLICVSCRHALPQTNHLLHVENEAFKKFYGKIPVEFASSMLYYHKKGIVQQLIHHLKYKNQQEIGKLIGEWYVNDLKENKIIQSVDCIIPVPLHQKRLKERGYNQVETFCKAIARELEKPFENSLLVRNEYAKTQSKKNLVNRNSVSESTFQAESSEVFHNKHFLLIDDVLTTGATLEACGKALLKIPGAKLSIVTMAFSQS